jgi:hypothetical protein
VRRESSPNPAPRTPATADGVRLSDYKTFRATAAGWPGTDGKGIHPACVYRFHSAGIAGVRLRALRLPGVGLVTTDDWVREFVEAVSEARKQTESS